jgi:hypothetical protein
MGGFVRVAAPVALSLVAPYALAGMGLAVPGMTAMVNGVAQPIFSWTSLMGSALSGLSSAMQYQQEGHANHQAALQRNAQLQAEYQKQALDEQRRQNKLRQLAASQRASQGAMGLVDSSSAEALISGLWRKNDEETAFGRNGLLGSYKDSLLDASHSKSQMGFELFRKTMAPTLSLLQEQ